MLGDGNKYARASRLQARRSLDVEAALVWAYRDQRVGGGSGLEGLLYGPGFSADGCVAVARQAELGCRIDTSGVAALYGAGGGSCHPDAERIHDAVGALRMRDPGAAQLVECCARIATPPDWAPENFTVGIDKRGRRFRGGTARCEGDLRLTREGGAYCEVYIYGGPEATERKRREWERWRGALVWLAVVLRGTLASITLIGPAAAREPWNAQRRGLPAKGHRLLSTDNEAALRQASADGAAPCELAARFGLTPKQVYEMLRPPRRRTLGVDNLANVGLA